MGVAAPPVALVDGGPGMASAHVLGLLADESVPVGALVALHSGGDGG
ncbi:MAG: hypothetical protein R3F65_10300 [bacterium]